MAEAAKKPEWRHDYHNGDDTRSSLANNEVPVVKMSTTSSEYNGKTRSSQSYSSTKHMYPPPEWMRLWLLIGRCHVQIFRDWVNYLELIKSLRNSKFYLKYYCRPLPI